MKENFMSLGTMKQSEVIKAKISEFPIALHSVAVADQILKENNGFYVFNSYERYKKRGELKTFIIDGEVMKAMRLGILGMYMDLVKAGEKDFADKVIKGNKE